MILPKALYVTVSVAFGESGVTVLAPASDLSAKYPATTGTLTMP